MIVIIPYFFRVVRLARGTTSSLERTGLGVSVLSVFGVIKFSVSSGERRQPVAQFGRYAA